MVNRNMTSIDPMYSISSATNSNQWREIVEVTKDLNSLF
jgi:hypothetical protein